MSKQGFTVCLRPRVTGRAGLADRGASGARPTPTSPGEQVCADTTVPDPSRRRSSIRASTIDDLADFTPEVRQLAIEAVQPISGSVRSSRRRPCRGRFSGRALRAVAAGRGPVSIPETGILYVPSSNAFSVKHFRQPESGENATLDVIEARGALTPSSSVAAGTAAVQAALFAHDRHRSQERRARVDETDGEW